MWTLQDDGYASKARPVVVIQGELGNVFDSVILCLFTSYDSSNLETRVGIAPSTINGLEKQSYVMTDKIITVARNELGKLIGTLTNEQMSLVTRQIARLLEITI